MWSNGSGALRARPHPIKIPTCIKKMPKELSVLKTKKSLNYEEQQQNKAQANAFKQWAMLKLAELGSIAHDLALES